MTNLNHTPEPDAVQGEMDEKSPPVPQGTYLDNDDVLIVNRTMARAYGLNESIALRQLHYWLRQFAKTKKTEHFRDGAWWVYNTYEQWQTDNFDFWSETTIRRTLLTLEEIGVIRSTSQYNKRPGDQTKWYTVDYAAHEAYMRLWASHLCPTAGNGHASAAYKDFMETWDRHRSDPSVVSAWGDQLSMMNRPTDHDGQTITRDYTEVTKTKDLIADRDGSSDAKKRKASGARKKTTASPPKPDPIKDALNEHCFKGSGGGYLLGPLTSWLKGEAEYVTANRQKNAVRRIGPQSIEDIAAFAADYTKKRKSTGESLTMPRNVIPFVLAYLHWLDARRPVAPAAPIDYSAYDATLDAAAFEVG